MSDREENKPSHESGASGKPRAPKPLPEVGGRGAAPGSPELTQKPRNPPTGFPVDLWPKTCFILDEAIAKYPDRSKLPELCGLYISMMTPLYCEAVKSGKMKAHAVLREDLGGMLDLLHSLLVDNDDVLGSRFGRLSSEAYRIYEQARNSKEFGELEKAIADAGG